MCLTKSLFVAVTLFAVALFDAEFANAAEPVSNCLGLTMCTVPVN